jgi:serine/threonine protein kinase
MGFTLLRQVGMGEFGRVYEALNHSNPNLPDRVALKVDRIRSWKKPKEILDAETTLQISRDLAASPHVIRIFDAGKLGRKKYTFHVLQFIDGDTLDNLLGVTGTEHASIHRPLSPHSNAGQVGDVNRAAFHGSAGEGWRRRRLALPFAETLSLAQTLDLLTSLLLWLEEIHNLGYANNDLKNGNLMVSRRGQVKGIDMDSYSPTFSPLDRVTDFYFLAVSLMLFLLNLDSPSEKPKVVHEHDLQSSDTIGKLIDRHWPFRDVHRISRGRTENAEVVALLADVIYHSRNQSYARQSEQFTAAIDRLIHLKRTIFAGEIVLD